MGEPMRKYSGLLVVIMALVFVLGAFSACSGSAVPAVKDQRVEHDEKFGGVYICITIDDFNALGYEFGDSVKITFSTGYVLEDIPYYNGYYVDMGEPLLVGYPGYPYIRAGFNNGKDMWEDAGLFKAMLTAPGDLWVTANASEGCTATVELNEKGKYLAIQRARDIHYSDEQGDKTDAEFANFRAVNVGNLKENVLYRSASPCDNQHKRAAVSDRLIAAAGVNFIVNLADDENELQSHIARSDFNSPHFLSLYSAGKVIPLSMNMVYNSAEFSEKLVRGLTAMAESDGPYLVHCVEGKDRTGYVCMVIEALAGASYQEMVDDYMVTYANYYGITKAGDKERYDVIKEKNIDIFLAYLAGDGADIERADYSVAATNYLKRLGMAEAKIEQLKARISN